MPGLMVTLGTVLELRSAAEERVMAKLPLVSSCIPTQLSGVLASLSSTRLTWSPCSTNGSDITLLLHPPDILVPVICNGIIGIQWHVIAYYGMQMLI